MANLANLNLEQLNQFKTQFEEEYEHLDRSYRQLKMAQERFADSKNILHNLAEQQDDQELLVPLTSSLYVKGKIVSHDNVLVDVGTGYFAQRKIDDAVGFMDRKIEFVKENLDKLGDTLAVKRSNIEAIVAVMQQKIAAQQQAGGAAAAAPRK